MRAAPSNSCSIAPKIDPFAAMSTIERTTYNRSMKTVAEKPSAERAASFTTVSGRPVKRLYTPEDLADIDPSRDLPDPGTFPYTRGIHATGYRGKLWTMRQFAGFGTPEDTNRRYKTLLEAGGTGLSVAFDLPTLMGRDPDHPLSLGEVGKCGVAITSLADMETLFDGIPMADVSTSMTINPTACILLAFYVACAERQGVDPRKLRGTIQNDMLKEYIAQKEWVFPPLPSMRIITDMMAFCADHVPKWNTISISGYHIREAGSTALQELAYTLMDGFTYVEFGMKAGIPVDAFAPRLSFFFNSHMDFFEEIAKFRAARRIWARRLKERYGAKNPESWRLRFHTQTAGCSLTAQQPENNIVRVAVQALSAVCGGAQSIHTNGFDEALALPTERSARIALRTQQVLAYESGAADTVDPFAGSYYIESLTDEIEARAWELIDKVEQLGGSVEALEFIQREIEESAASYHERYRTGQDTVVGVNKFVTDEIDDVEILRVDPESEKRQLERLRRFKESRDSEIATETIRSAGATIMGRKMFSNGDGPWEDDPKADGWWGDDPPFHHPVFILTHHPRETVTKEGGTTFTFVTGGIGDDLARGPRELLRLPVLRHTGALDGADDEQDGKQPQHRQDCVHVGVGHPCRGLDDAVVELVPHHRPVAIHFHQARLHKPVDLRIEAADARRQL